jgi:DNA-directed RNA polymerase specialized sigma24 family protein
MANPSDIEPDKARGARFDTTQWSLVLQAGASGDSVEARRAMACLCSAYWYPLYVFIRRQGHKADVAEELTQEFFTRFLDRDFLGAADKSRGKFRTFLLACCRHFLANQRDFALAQKRGGGQPVLSLDFSGARERYEQEPATSWTAEKLFERRWALTLLDQVLQQLRQEYRAQDKGDLFEHLRTVLVGESQALSYAQIGTSVGMTEDAVKKAAQRLRQRYGLMLREQITATVDEPGLVDEEIRDLFAALSG